MWPAELGNIDTQAQFCDYQTDPSRLRESRPVYLHTQASNIESNAISWRELNPAQACEADALDGDASENAKDGKAKESRQVEDGQDSCDERQVDHGHAE